MMTKPIHVIGGGLAGSEAAWQIAQAGVPVTLHEMRPVRGTDAHQTDGLAELVCSNSFRSDDWEHNAVGLLHAEMRACDSIIMACGDANQVPAGGALAGRVRKPGPMLFPRVGIYGKDGSTRFRVKASPAVRRLRASHIWRVRFVLRRLR